MENCRSVHSRAPVEILEIPYRELSPLTLEFLSEQANRNGTNITREIVRILELHLNAQADQNYPDNRCSPAGNRGSARVL